MVRQIAPVFFTMDISATLAYYTGKLGFACPGTWQDRRSMPSWTMVARDQQVIHSGLFPLRAPSRARTFIFAGCKYSPDFYFCGLQVEPAPVRCAAPPAANPDKYADELLDAYLFVEDADALYAEYAAKGVEFTRGLGNMPWHRREVVVKDCDGRLLAFGANL